MRDDREPGRGGAGVAILLVVVLFFLPALYILSCGPAVALMTRGYLSEEVFDILYFPLSAAANSSDWISDILNGYADLWSAYAAIVGQASSLPKTPLGASVPLCGPFFLNSAQRNQEVSHTGAQRHGAAEKPTPRGIFTSPSGSPAPTSPASSLPAS